MTKNNPPSKNIESPKDSSENKSKATENKPSLITPNTVVTFSLEWSQIQSTYAAQLAKSARLIKIDGFRAGKVPPALAEKHLDSQKLYNQVLDVLLPPAYAEALQKSGHQPLTQPDINPVKMKAQEDWEFEASFALRPVIQLGKYQDVVKKALKVAEKEIESAAKSAPKAPTKKPTTKEAAESADIEEQAPQIEPKEIKTRVVLQTLVDQIKPQVQELLVRQEVTRQLQRLSEKLEKLKLTAENYLKSRNMTAEDLQREYTGVALTTLQLEFIMAQIALDQKVTVTDKEIDDLLDQNFGGKLTDEQKRDQNIRSYVFSTQLKQRVLDYLLSL